MSIEKLLAERDYLTEQRATLRTLLNSHGIDYLRMENRYGNHYRVVLQTQALASRQEVVDRLAEGVRSAIAYIEARLAQLDETINAINTLLNGANQ